MEETKDFNKYELTFCLFSKITSMPCNYCGSLDSIGVDRMDNYIGYTKDNSTPCCTKCNFSKRDSTKEDFLKWAKKLSTFQGWY